MAYYDLIKMKLVDLYSKVLPRTVFNLMGFLVAIKFCLSQGAKRWLTLDKWHKIFPTAWLYTG